MIIVFSDSILYSLLRSIQRTYAACFQNVPEIWHPFATPEAITYRGVHETQPLGSLMIMTPSKPMEIWKFRTDPLWIYGSNQCSKLSNTVAKGTSSAMQFRL